MRGTSLFAGAAALLAGAGASIAAATRVFEDHHMGRTRYRTGFSHNGWCRFHPVTNRHTGRPHEHKREIARRVRQQAARQ